MKKKSKENSKVRYKKFTIFSHVFLPISFNIEPSTYTVRYEPSIKYLVFF